MAYCSNCGTSVNGGSYCVNCGAAQGTLSGDSSGGVVRPATVPTTNGLAIASLIMSLIGFSLLGIIFGHVARGQISRSNGAQVGDGLAVAGLIIGYIWAAIVIVAVFGALSA